MGNARELANVFFRAARDFESDPTDSKSEARRNALTALMGCLSGRGSTEGLTALDALLAAQTERDRKNAQDRLDRAIARLIPA